MPIKKSAGILLYRKMTNEWQVFLVHPGGPFWKNKDMGSWSIPKGEFNDGEAPLDAAIRELQEETGLAAEGNFIELEPIKQKGGKMVYAWALEADIDPRQIMSNTFEIEWPPRSGRMQSFPEVDKGEWFGLEIAKAKINPSQSVLINELSIKIAQR